MATTSMYALNNPVPTCRLTLWGCSGRNCYHPQSLNPNASRARVCLCVANSLARNMQTEEKTKPLGRCPFCKSKLSGRTEYGIELIKCSRCNFVGFRNESHETVRDVLHRLYPRAENREPISDDIERELLDLTDDMEREYPTYQLNFSNDFSGRAYRLMCSILRLT